MSVFQKIGDFAEDMTITRFFFTACFLYGVAQVGGKWYINKQRTEMINAAMHQGDAGLALLGISPSCKNKKCITVYLAPWCPVCKTTEVTLKNLQQKLPLLRPGVGLSVIVTADTSQRIADKRKELKTLETFADDRGDLRKLRGVKAYPTWVIVDEKGHQLFTRSGGMAIESNEELEKLLTEFLQI